MHTRIPLWCLILLFAAPSWCAAQQVLLERTVTVDCEDCKARQIFRQLRKQGIPLSYSDRMLNDLRYTFSGPKKLRSLLQEVLAYQPMGYKVMDGRIVLQRGIPPHMRRMENTLTGLILGDDEPLAYATVYLLRTNEGVIAEENGRFTLRGLPDGTYDVVIRTIGYNPDTVRVELAGGQKVDIRVELTGPKLHMATAVISTDKLSDRTTVSQMVHQPRDLDLARGVTLDPMCSVATFPGISTSGSIFDPSNLSVRGGNPEENLVMLDNVPIYWPWYFVGKSILNNDMLAEAEILTGAYPAQYGNHLSSIMNFKTRNGDFESFRAKAGLSLLETHLTMEGPLVKNKLALLGSLRRTNFDFLLLDSLVTNRPHQYDLSLKLAWHPRAGQQITLSSLSVLDIVDIPDMGFGAVDVNNRTSMTSLQWKAIVSKKVYNKLSLVHGLQDLDASLGPAVMDIFSNRYGLRDDLTWFMRPTMRLKAGLDLANYAQDHDWTAPLWDETNLQDTTAFVLNTANKINGWRWGMYSSWEAGIGKRFSTHTGLRMDYNSLSGEADLGLRLAMSYQLHRKTKIRFAFGQYYQIPDASYLDLNPDLQSALAEHFVLGIRHQFNPKWQGWAEIYLKEYYRLVTSSPDGTVDNEGRGTAAGMEFFIRRSSGRLQGWLSYTLSASERRENDLDTIRPHRFDLPHIFHLVGAYQFRNPSGRWYIPQTVTAMFRANAGRPYTPASAAVLQSNQTALLVQGTYNSARLRPYFNLRFRLNWEQKVGKRRRHQLGYFIEFWNVFNTRNVQAITYGYAPAKIANLDIRAEYSDPFLFTLGLVFRFNAQQPASSEALP